MPNLDIEKSYPHKIVCGVDEVGRGCLAGDVYACAVILPKDFPEEILNQLNDSKKISSQKREYLSEEIKKNAIWSIGIATVEEIAEINILHAAMLAMERAIAGLKEYPDVALIDGNRAPNNLKCESQTVVKGDAKSCSIAAASIIAKVDRDKKMAELAKDFPHYAWEKNAGYGTKAHMEGIDNHGITPWHRSGFSPIKQLKLI